MTKRFTLGKNERLKSRKQIEQLFSMGKSFVVTPLRVHFVMNGEGSTEDKINGLQFGVGVSNKNFKRSVDRNRIKRLIREAWRLQKGNLYQLTKAFKKQLNVFIIYTGKDIPDFHLVKDKVEVILQKLSKLINENIAANS